ncbi:MAG: adenosine-specific kinase [Thermodesulfobacteriota bacterium]
MELILVPLEIPKDANLIMGQSHFIKTVEDLYEIMAGSVPGMDFGIAFCEASMECLVRTDGNSDELTAAAVRNATAVAAGHTFYILLRKAYPINVLNALKSCPEVCRIFCATANPVYAVVAKNEQGCGVLGVIDGFSPKGIETEADQAKRKALLQAIGYKR